MYMAVTADKYELPIAVEDTAVQLSKALDVPISSIYSGISRGDSGVGRGYRFVKVEEMGD